MYRDFDEAGINALLDATYDAAVSPEGWRPVLDRLAGTFRCHFADVFTRSTDWRHFRGIAVGLDRADYDEGFLATWCNRNVWSKAKPVRVAGEVLATWQMVDKATMLRSEMYADFLQPRDLNEGLRLSLWTDEDWIQDVSLIRPWAAGAFGPDEMALGRFLLPHLQRAASLSRRLGRATAVATLEAIAHPALLVGEGGRIHRVNGAGEDLLAEGIGLQCRQGHLVGAPIHERRVQAAIAGAAGADRQAPRADRLALPGPDDGSVLHVDVVPVGLQTGWSLPTPRAVLVIARRHWTPRQPAPADLMERHGLTGAEADLALALLAGRTPAEVAAETGRSVNTIRSHLARVLSKTQTRRQSELIRLLADPTRGSAAALPGELGVVDANV